MSSKLYQFQEWLEGKISEILPENIEVLCRRKGNVENDVQNALSTLGIAVIVEPPLPLTWSKSYILKAETIETEIHILENVMLQTTEESAYTLLETIAKAPTTVGTDEIHKNEVFQVKDILPLCSSANFLKTEQK